MEWAGFSNQFASQYLSNTSNNEICIFHERWWCHMWFWLYNCIHMVDMCVYTYIYHKIVYHPTGKDIWYFCAIYFVYHKLLIAILAGPCCQIYYHVTNTAKDQKIIMFTINIITFLVWMGISYQDNKVHVANMRPTWVLSELCPVASGVRLEVVICNECRKVVGNCAAWPSSWSSDRFLNHTLMV